jgi:uncharacterized protein
MPWQPPQPSRGPRARAQAWTTFLVAALLVALLAYLGYFAFEGSRLITAHVAPSRDCRTPALLEWAYEPVNYDGDADALLADEIDPLWCTRLGPPAGDRLVAADGTRIAGWYIPAAGEIGPREATVVLTHGWGSNKSNMLPHAEMLRERYNVVAFDLRGHGQSSGQITTQGVLEQHDLRAMIDWLEREKGPRQIAVLGVSMGGATAVNAAQRDRRIDALVLDSTHATLASAIQARLERAGYPLSVPASWAVLFGGLVRTGHDLSAVDPARAIARVGDTPVLVVHGGADGTMSPRDADELRGAAEAAGVPVELRICPEAGHAAVLSTCPHDYRSWVLGFLERALGR